MCFSLSVQDFKDEMSDKEKAKNDLVDQGRQLVKISSEVRASDIEQKITRLEDKWEHLKAVIGFRYVNGISVTNVRLF